MDPVQYYGFSLLSVDLKFIGSQVGAWGFDYAYCLPLGFEMSL